MQQKMAIHSETRGKQNEVDQERGHDSGEPDNKQRSQGLVDYRREAERCYAGVCPESLT